MSRGTEKLLKGIKSFVDLNYKIFSRRYGQQIMDILEFPVKVVYLPFYIAVSTPRGFGVPELISKISYSAIFELPNLLWMVGHAMYHVQRLRKGALPSEELCIEKVDGHIAFYTTLCLLISCGEKAASKNITDAITDNQAKLVHLPSSVDLHLLLPSKDCPNCDGSIMKPPWKAYNIMQKMDYPYEHEGP